MQDQIERTRLTRVLSTEVELYTRIYGTCDADDTNPTLRSEAFLRVTNAADRAIKFTRSAFLAAHKIGKDANLIRFKCGGRAADEHEPRIEGLFTTEYKEAFLAICTGKHGSVLSPGDFADLLAYGKYVHDYGNAKVCEWRTPLDQRPYAAGVKVKVRGSRAIADPTFDAVFRRLYAIGDPDGREYAACQWVRDNDALVTHGIYTGHVDGTVPTGEGGASSGAAIVHKKEKGITHMVQEGRPTPTSTGFHAGVRHLCEPGLCPRLDYTYCNRCMHRVLRTSMRHGQCIACIVDREWIADYTRAELPAKQAAMRAFDANEEACTLAIEATYDADPILADAVEHAVNAAIAAEAEYMALRKLARELTACAAHAHNEKLHLDDMVDDQGYGTGNGFHVTPAGVIV